MASESLETEPKPETSPFTREPETEAINGLQQEDEAVVQSVLVVGAGPAGLMLASNLARFGIDVRIIDDRADATSAGRADGLQPKTIETFRQLRLADGLLKKGVKIYDICFWNSTPISPMSRTSREIHYPPSVDTLDPYVLLVHQGMIEDVFLEDLKSRDVQVIRNSSLIRCSSRYSDQIIESTVQDMKTSQQKILQSHYVIGCDGAHSQVRKSMPGVTMEGQSGNAAWGVLDGVIETNFPDIWSKAVIHSQAAGSMLSIPRERNMTRLYIELHPGTTKPIADESQNQEFIMQRAAEILHPFTIEWKSTEWFSIYRVGQRVASQFALPLQGLFIVGDAAHTHSPKAAQGMNVSMHDAFNLAWKLNLVLRKIAPPSLLNTYELERKQIAQQLIAFDFEHANAFLAGDAPALAQNFDDNVRFIAGVVGYGPNELNQLNPEKKGYKGEPEPRKIKGTLLLVRPGALLPPARVTRFIDANPVHIQLDIPLLSQFRIYVLIGHVQSSMPFLTEISAFLTTNNARSVLSRASRIAQTSYESLKIRLTEIDEYERPERYTAVSRLFTPALVATSTQKSEFEISDLPFLFSSSPWTVYLDDIGAGDVGIDSSKGIGEGRGGCCTRKWLGRSLEVGEVAIVNVRPDGYVGSVGLFEAREGEEAKEWLDGYYGVFLNG